jgi:putative FmdB family regulatory protein
VKTGEMILPIYEYRCDSCEHELEKIQKMSEDMLVDCPECSEPALKRLISAAAFRLKGSGWYETDFKKDNKRNLADISGNDTSDSKSSEPATKVNGKSTSESGSKKPEATPAAKPAAKTASKESKHA